MGTAAPTIRRLTGVYDVCGTPLAELRYVLDRGLGRRHCSLCEITHGALREKRSWRTFRSSLAVPFDTVHLDEQAPKIAALTRGSTPAVVAETDDGAHLLLGPTALEACAGDPQELIHAIERAASELGLVLPAR